jgi:hypothetical protein
MLDDTGCDFTSKYFLMSETVSSKPELTKYFARESKPEARKTLPKKNGMPDF